MPFSPHEFLFVFLVLPLAFAVYVGQRLFASKPVLLFLLTGAVLAFSAVPEGPVLANPAEEPNNKTKTSPILDAIGQNTPGQSEGYPVGVPRELRVVSRLA